MRIVVLFILGVLAGMAYSSTVAVWAFPEAEQWTVTPTIRVVMKSNSDWGTWVFDDSEGKNTNGIRFKEVLGYRYTVGNDEYDHVYAGSAPQDLVLIDSVTFGKAQSATGGPDYDYTEMYAEVILEVDTSFPKVFFVLYGGDTGKTTFQLSNNDTGGILWEQTYTKVGSRGKKVSLSAQDLFWDGSIATLRDHALCASVVDGRPEKVKEGFTPEDPAIYFYSTYEYKERFGRTSSWSLQWYAPDGSLLDESSQLVKSQQGVGSTLASLKQGRVPIGSLPKGIWHVDQHANGVLLVRVYFTVGDYLVEVQISGLPSTMSVQILLDANAVYEVKGEVVKSVAVVQGGHTISVQPSAVEVAEDSRYACSPESWTFSSPGSHAFNYVPQHRVVVEAPAGFTEGSGWYAEGETATFEVQPVVGKEPGVQYVFMTWTGDYSGTSPTGSLVIDAPKKVTAVYKIQFYLGVGSPYGDPKGEGWYDEGSTATFSVTAELDHGNGTKRIFVGWSGDSAESSSSATILMDAPHAVTANWRTETTGLGGYSMYIVAVVAILVIVLVAAILLRRKKMTKPPVSPDSA